MLAEILGTQAVCPQITFHSSQTVAPDRAHKNQPVKARQRSLQLIPVLGDKLIHRCFPFREILSSNNNIVRKRKHLFYLVAAMLLCGAGPPACAGVSAPLRSRGGLGGRRRPGGPPPQDQLTDDSENQLVLRTCACRVGTFADAGLPSRG